MTELRSVPVRGTRIDTGPIGAVIEVTDEWIRNRHRGVIFFANVHVVETARQDPELASALAGAELVLPDGAPIAWFAGRKTGWRVPRITGSDFFESVALRDNGLRRHLFFGSTASTLQQLQSSVRAMNPRVDIVGAISPPFGVPTPQEIIAAAAQINGAAPDVVWVGLGAPRQENWIAQARPLLDAPVLAGVGAVFDFYSGNRRRAPSWAQKAGVEWGYRLLQEPLRLGPRYARTNASFLLGAAAETIGARG